MPENVLTQDSGIDGHTSSRANGCSGFYRRAGKRWVDLMVSASGIVLTSPFLIACACAIKLDSSGPILFQQKRVGLHGKLFTVLKFRSMRIGSERDHLKITVAGDPRVTAVGKWLRKTKLDELPQLFNVLCGDMSLIGPRPEVPEYVRQYDQTQRLVLQVKPGITGLSSLEFIDEEELLRGASNPRHFYCTKILPRKIALDLNYCQRASFITDCGIAFRTVLRILTVRRLFTRS
jgi:lipopolysaccharide/colanic/teichoic acid biosynthesis glycosyltransferase